VPYRRPSLERLAALLAIIAIVAAATGCGSSDPAARKLAERARWNATLLSWAQSPDGTVSGTARLSGPPASQLPSLTVRLQIVGEDGQTIEKTWQTFDLSDVERGGPADKRFTIASYPHAVGGIGIDPVLAPTPEERARIPELN
jgi:hypothetical protein